LQANSMELMGMLFIVILVQNNTVISPSVITMRSPPCPMKGGNKEEVNAEGAQGVTVTFLWEVNAGGAIRPLRV
jgi:hypothetical protein